MALREVVTLARGRDYSDLHWNGKQKQMRRLLNKIFGRAATVPASFAGLRKGAGAVFTPIAFVPKPEARFSIGANSMFCGNMYFDKAGAEVIIGNRTYVGGNLMCAHKIIIGDDVLISSGGAVFDHDSHAIDFELRKNDVSDYIKGEKDWTNVPIKEVTIGPFKRNYNWRGCCGGCGSSGYKRRRTLYAGRRQSGQINP
jgi:hypothetical protein